MISPRDQSGSLLLEAMLAGALLVIFVTATASLAITANRGTAKALTRQVALWRAQEGIEALRTMAFGDLFPTESGTVVWNGTSWVLSEGGSEDLGGNLVRTVRVGEVMRDENCVIVPTGGTTDPDTLDLESEVSWIDPVGRSEYAVFSQARTRYDDPQGPCFLAEQAGQVGINLTLEAEWFGLKQLRTLYIENTGSDPITIAEMTLTWDNAEVLSQVFIDSTKVWSSTGPGLPSETLSSGAEMDILDYTIPAGTTVEINKAQFSNDMRGTTVTLQLEFSDGSQITSDPFTPTW